MIISGLIGHDKTVCKLSCPNKTRPYFNLLNVLILVLNAGSSSLFWIFEKVSTQKGIIEKQKHDIVSHLISALITSSKGDHSNSNTALSRQHTVTH